MSAALSQSMFQEILTRLIFIKEKHLHHNFPKHSLKDQILPLPPQPALPLLFPVLLLPANRAKFIILAVVEAVAQPLLHLPHQAPNRAMPTETTESTAWIMSPGCKTIKNKPREQAAATSTIMALSTDLTT